MSVPEGYVELSKGLGFNDQMAPVYYKYSDEGVRFGFTVMEQHCNTAMICHGGMLMSFSDLALAGAVAHGFGEMVTTPTISLNVNFMKPGALGAWLEMEVTHLHLTRTLGFAEGYIHDGENRMATANGVFKLPKRKEENS